MKHQVKKVKKLGRSGGARKALHRDLMISLIDKGSIETTVAKAKSVRPLLERLVSMAKKNNLASYRYIIAKLGNNTKAAKKLFNEITPLFKDKTSGFLSIKRTRIRAGDAAELAKISFTVQLPKVKPVENKGDIEAKKTSTKSKKVKTKAK
ncbi:MAG: 50S ribosomal protein L17 [Patescibacteria group bacterium]|nr:50S ribosomal protein L17 [Patescibacteria group bacterium]